MAGNVLELKHVSAWYQEGKKRIKVLSDVSFTICEGETIGLVGESGSGKTTLCKCILGLLRDYEGEVIHHTKRPQMVFQDPFGSLNPKKKIGWILEEPLKIAGGYSREERKTKAEEMLARVQLSPELYDHYPRELSGGQRQRVSVGLALMTGSKFILLDEPLSALDVTVQAEILKLLERLQREERLTYLFVSHDLDVVSALCNKILVLMDGNTELFDYHEKTEENK